MKVDYVDRRKDGGKWRNPRILKFAYRTGYASDRIQEIHIAIHILIQLIEKR